MKSYQNRFNIDTAAYGNVAYVYEKADDACGFNVSSNFV